jgi:hypothetical protein
MGYLQSASLDAEQKAATFSPSVLTRIARLFGDAAMVPATN